MIYLVGGGMVANNEVHRPRSFWVVQPDRSGLDVSSTRRRSCVMRVRRVLGALAACLDEDANGRGRKIKVAKSNRISNLKNSNFNDIASSGYFQSYMPSC